MVRVSNKIAVGEKGQRTARSTDVYLPRGGGKEAAFCLECGALYRNKRWAIDEAELARLRRGPGLRKVICPACQRMAEHNPAGIVVLGGAYLSAHRDEILRIVRHVEAKSRVKNPLGRIMEVRDEAGGITISTTEDKLAQKLGRELFRSHRGELHYSWSHEHSFVRVSWSR